MGLNTKLPRKLVSEIELQFFAIHRWLGTEDRVLVYADEAGNLLYDRSDMDRRPGSVTCDVELAVEHDGRLWDLAFDLHSHHRMGAFWSATDDANERLRGPVFGVCSWQAGWPPAWLFRRFIGQGFEDIPIEEVVDDG